MYIRFLFGCLLFSAQSLAVRSCAGDESADYRVLKFQVAAEGDVLLLPVRFGDRTFDFALDTGSSESIFDACFRDKMGPPIGSDLAHTPAGDYWHETFKAPAATIAGRPLSGLYAVSCESLSLFRAAFGHEMHGILGMDFLHGRCIRINFDAGELTILESVPAGPGEPIALTYSREHGVRALVEVEGAGPLPFAIDTGGTERETSAGFERAAGAVEGDQRRMGVEQRNSARHVLRGESGCVGLWPDRRVADCVGA